MTVVDPAQIDALHAKVDRLLERTAQPQRFMSIRTAAAYADLSQDSVRRLLERGELTAYRPVKGKILVDRLELDGVILGSIRRPVTGRGIRRNGRQSVDAEPAAGGEGNT